MSAIVYAYNKKRCDFGKQPLFCLTKAELLDSINPDKIDQKQYGLRNPVNRESQVGASKSECEINTIKVELKTRGINHFEGGWPLEVNWNNPEETLRYRRRIERDDSYVHAVMTVTPKLEYYIKQNNAIEIYQQYYKGMQEIERVEKPSVSLNNVYRDPNKRPVASLCWTMEDDPKLAVTYCDKKYPVTGPVNNNFTGYVWVLDDPHAPAAEFVPPSACWQIACSPASPELIAGGLEDGRVCVFDLRAGTEPIAISPPHVAHRNPVTALIYIQSRLSNEFFTGSSDGQCMWYDVRNLSRPLECLIVTGILRPGLQVNSSNAEAVSTLQFDRAFPTRFLCGTDTGLVINVNRKGKTHSEVISAIFKAHRGPVRAVQRSPCTSKMFITCGDWTAHIWSDEVKTSPIITGLQHRHQIMDVAWAPNRVSGYMTAGVDGKLRYWDLLRRFHKPVANIVLSKYPLLKIVPHNEGRLVVLGDKGGTVFLVSLSEDLVISGEKDKQLMIQAYERESRREHILENRIKEIRLKHKAAEEASGQPAEEVYDEEVQLRVAEEEYRRQVVEEFRRAGIPHTSIHRGDTMRNR